MHANLIRWREKGWSSVICSTYACACAPSTFLCRCAVAACIVRPRIGWSSSSVSLIWYYKIFIENFNSCAGSSNDVSVEAQWMRHAIRDQTAAAAAARIFRTSLEPHLLLLHTHMTFVASSFSLFYLSSCFHQKLVRVPANECVTRVYSVLESTFVYLPFSNFRLSPLLPPLVGYTCTQFLVNFK